MHFEVVKRQNQSAIVAWQSRPSGYCSDIINSDYYSADVVATLPLSFQVWLCAVHTVVCGPFLIPLSLFPITERAALPPRRRCALRCLYGHFCVLGSFGPSAACAFIRKVEKKLCTGQFPFRPIFRPRDAARAHTPGVERSKRIRSRMHETNWLRPRGGPNQSSFRSLRITTQFPTEIRVKNHPDSSCWAEILSRARFIRPVNSLRPKGSVLLRASASQGPAFKWIDAGKCLLYACQHLFKKPDRWTEKKYSGFCMFFLSCRLLWLSAAQEKIYI